MKRTRNIITGLFLLAGVMFIISSCEERALLDYTPYDPAAPAPFTYNESVYYPQRIVMTSDTPVFTVQGVYMLKIDSVHVLTEGGAFQQSAFSIDDATGVISYDNTGGTINPGQYALDISIQTVNSIVRMPEPWTLTVLDVPVSITVTPEEVTTGALQQGNIALITYTDESPKQEITEVTYAINPSVPGFSVDSTGNVIKSTSAPTDTTVVLSVQVNTNLGTKTFPDVLTVHVGAPPTILYTKAADGDTLHRVILSPVAAWSSQPPVLEGMNADGGWAVILADTVPQEVKDALSIDANGVVSVAAGSNLPDGEYVVGVRATNSSGVSFDFTDLFTLEVQTRWNEIVYDDTEFSSDTIAYYMDPASATSFIDGGGYVKGYHDEGATFISWFVAAVDIGADWNGMELTISFEERNGWGAKQDPVYQETVRTLQYSYDSLDWTDVMSATDPDWPMSGAGKEYHAIKDQSVGEVDLNQSVLYFKWYYDNSASDTKTKSVWMIDNLKFRYTIDFDIVEE